MRKNDISTRLKFSNLRLSWMALSALGLASCSTVAAPENQAPVTAYVNAHLFDGVQFKSGTLCVSQDKFSNCVDQPEETIDLNGLYLTPPFGDAHTHHFDGTFTLDWHLSLGRESGTFYAMTMTAPTIGVGKIRDRISGGDIVDVATSLGGITGPESHPAEVYEALALGFRTQEEQILRVEEIRLSRLYADNAYYVVETENDVRAKINLLMESDPDHIKVYLRESERYAEGTGKWGPGGGIDPALLPLIRSLADTHDKRLAVATSSVTDFRVALESKADIATHLPCYQDTEDDPSSFYYSFAVAEDCLLTRAEADAAAKQGLISTLIVTEWAKDRPDKYVDWERANIETLRQAGAQLIVASNNYGSTMTEGLISGVKKSFFKPGDLLKMASMDTPSVIFPDRAIGCLEAGCEASFIGFADNPLDNFETIRNISFALKDGVIVIPFNEGRDQP